MLTILRNSESLNNISFFENYGGAILIADDTKGLLMVNKAFQQLTDYTAAEIEPARLLPPNSSSWQWDKPGSSMLHQLDCKGGKTVIVHLTVSLLTGRDDSRYYVYSFIDLSETMRQLHAKAQSELSHLNKELKRSNEELEQFAYVASHDLQEPLRMVSSYVQLMQKQIEKGSYAQVNELMHFVTDGVKRMQALINDLLQFSRVNRKGSPFVVVDLNEVLEITIGHLSERIKDNKADIKYSSMPSIKGDTFQMIRLFQNLVENAIKFQSPGKLPKITISVKEQGKNYLFSIKDNGIGIENKFHNRIFAIFQRLHTRAEYEGTGIGLAVCKKIVERHGGEIWIESQPGEGSIFFFTLKK